MRVGVTGSRSLDDRDLVFSTLDGIHSIKKITMLITGGCGAVKIGQEWRNSADKLAEEWAASRGVDNLIRRAKWTELGRSAGPIRNSRMIKDKPEMMVAFPGGAGTADCVRKAERAGVPVRRVQHQKRNKQ